jgi:CHASE2 domain-containing sensor protein
VGVLVAATPLNAWLSRAAGDLQLRLLARSQPQTVAVVLDIDDASLEELKPRFGPWPWKRDVHALAIEQLREAGARAIALDLVLADAGSADAALARTLARPGAPVLLAAAGLRDPSDELARAPGAAPPAGLAYRWPGLVLPAASLRPAGQLPPLGVITTPLDGDGVLRRLPLWHRDAARQLPVMPWAVYRALDTAAAAAPPLLDDEGMLHLALPARAAQPKAIPFAALARAEHDDRAAAALRAAVSGRVVFVGSSALLADAVMTTQGQLSGTAVLA